MIPYIFIILFFLCISIVTIKKKLHSVKQRNFVLFIEFLMIVVFVGSRECGFDYENYQLWFKELHSPNWFSKSLLLGSEPGYAFLNLLCPNFRILLFLIATVTVGNCWIFIKKQSPLPFVCTFFFVLSFLLANWMGQYRQALALSFFLLAINFIENKKIFIPLIIIASTFHITVLIVFLIFLLPKRILNFNKYIFVLLIALFVNQLGNIFIYQFNSLLPAFVATKLGIYFIAEEGASVGLNLSMILRLVIFTVFYCNRNHILKFKNGILFFNIYFLSLLIYLGLGAIPQIGGRLSLYFSSMELIMATFLIFKRDKWYLQYLFFFIILIYRFINVFIDWDFDYIPYKSSFL